MNQTELNKKCYLKNYITNVIFKIDFSEILKLINDTPVEFQDKIREEFPSLEIKDLVQITTGIDKGKDIYDKKISKTYVFKNKDKLQQVEINSSFFAVVFFKYHMFEELSKTILDTFRIFQDLFSPLDIKRVGLRYINEIKIQEGNPLEWEQFINEKLVSHLDAFRNNKEYLNRSMNQMIYKFDDYILLFNYGIFNQEFPNLISRKEFILDYDCYTTNIPDNDITKLLAVFHSKIQTLFEISITENLRDKMGVKND
jgi:uncharacterized protein (TIGR04255 family)